jgi:hypothetical protein
MVVAKVRESLALSKHAALKLDRERFNLGKLNKLEVSKENQIEISNRTAALENLSDSADINRVWENIKENIKTSITESLGLHELNQHKPWFKEECLGLLDQRKQATMQWVQDPSQSSVENLNNVIWEASRQKKKKKKAYLKAKIEERETNSKIRDLYRGINDFRRVTSLELI